MDRKKLQQALADARKQRSEKEEKDPRFVTGEVAPGKLRKQVNPPEER
jgi:hypothetical protein